MPKLVNVEVLAEFQKFKRLLDPALHEQIDRVNQKNVEDGRELTLANCWFVSESELERMWKEYAGGGSEGVAIKSTIGLLAHHVFCDARVTTNW